MKAITGKDSQKREREREGEKERSTDEDEGARGHLNVHAGCTNGQCARKLLTPTEEYISVEYFFLMKLAC